MFSNSMRKRYLIGLLLGIISLGLVGLFASLNFFRVLELKLLDYRFRYRSLQPTHEKINIAAIDDYSLQKMGTWPVPRKYQAALLQALAAAPPKVIGYDVLFIEPSADDESLVYYSRLLGNVVYAGYVREADKQAVLPFSGLCDAARVGFINAPADRDGVVRRVPLLVQGKDKVYPSFSLQVLCSFLDIDFADLSIVTGKEIRIPLSSGDSIFIPLDERNRLLINYADSLAGFNSYSFFQLLSWQRQRPEQLKDFADQLMLVGLTATGTADYGATPLAANEPLIAVQANVLNTILNEDFLLVLPFWGNFFVVLLMVIISVVINISLRPLRAALVTLLVLTVYWGLNLLAFSNSALINLSVPLLGLIFPFVLITVYRYGWEEKQRRWTKKAFSHYVSQEVIEDILASPQRLKLGGEKREATILFLDLRNFTTFCEGRPPEEVVRILNDCFDWMTEIILRHGGMLDKYIGDAIMAIIGAPASLPAAEQVRRAVTIAREIVRTRKVKAPELGIGIGLNIGPMVVGNMGSRYIFDYTAIGDEVNIARRVEELTRKYDVEIIITEAVRKHLAAEVKVKQLGEVTVKGRREPVRIYGIVEN